MKHKLSAIAKAKKLELAGLSEQKSPNTNVLEQSNDKTELPSIDLRIKKILQIIQSSQYPANCMLFLSCTI